VIIFLVNDENPPYIAIRIEFTTILAKISFQNPKQMKVRMRNAKLLTANSLTAFWNLYYS